MPLKPKAVCVPITPKAPGINTINGLIEQLQASQTYTVPGPAVLDLVNEISWAFEDFFADRERSLALRGDNSLIILKLRHKTFLDRLANRADHIRQTNGQIDEDFFRFVRGGPYRTLLAIQ